MSSIEAMVTTKLEDDSPGAAADTRKKFVVLVDEETKHMIDHLSAVTRTGKIELSSQILTIGLAEAVKVAQDAGKIDAEGNAVGVKVKTSKSSDDSENEEQPVVGEDDSPEPGEGDDGEDD